MDLVFSNLLDAALPIIMAVGTLMVAVLLVQMLTRTGSAPIPRKPSRELPDLLQTTNELEHEALDYGGDIEHEKGTCGVCDTKRVQTVTTTAERKQSISSGVRVTTLDLRGADLRGQLISDVSASTIDLRDADLRNATLRSIRATHIDLSNADLRKATLIDVKASIMVMNGAKR